MCGFTWVHSLRTHARTHTRAHASCCALGLEPELLNNGLEGGPSLPRSRSAPTQRRIDTASQRMAGQPSTLTNSTHSPLHTPMDSKA